MAYKIKPTGKGGPIVSKSDRKIDQQLESVFKTSQLDSIPSVTTDQEIQVDPAMEILPPNLARNLEIAQPGYYQPRDVTEIISQPASFLPKWQLYTTAELFCPRISADMKHLKQIISSKPFDLVPYDNPTDPAAAQLKYDLVKDAIGYMSPNTILNRNGMKQMIEDIVQAYGYGITVQEIAYDEVAPGLYYPANTFFVNPYDWQYDVVSNAFIFMHNRAPLPQWKYIVAAYRNRSTKNLNYTGIYQNLMYLFVCQYWTRIFWMQALEKFGMPTIVVNYPSNASPTMMNQVISQLKNLGNSRYGAFPEGTTAQFLETSISSGDTPAHQVFINEIDRQIDIEFFGQNLSTEVDKNGSRAAAETHQEKENKVIQSITNFVLDTLNGQFVAAILNVNGFDTQDAPKFIVPEAVDHETLKRKLDVIQQLKSIGYKVSLDSLEKELEQYGLKIEGEVEPDQEENNSQNSNSKEESSAEQEDSKE